MDIIINRLREELGCHIEWFDGPTNGLPGVGWLLVEVNPLPFPDEMDKVISDILNGNVLGISGGRLHHSIECSESEHNLNNHIIKKAMESLSEQKYKLAIYPGQSNLLNGQPIIISIEPEINYLLFPDHPHLNTGAQAKLNKDFFVIPDSFCYTSSPKELGVNIYDRLENAIDQATIWLLVHQIWVESRKFIKRGEWIGLEATRFSNYEYSTFLSLNGQCWCGEKSNYKDCHFVSDFESLVKRETILRTDFEEVRAYLVKSVRLVQQRIELQRSSLEKLKSVLI